MVIPPVMCPVPTNTDKIWTYDQYYTGKRDAVQRKSGYGQNNWTGAESLEWYTGRFLRDTMHGEGEYRSRFRGDEGVSVTYEGNFYANHMHGYGTMSYPDGAVFTGLFHKDMRWGPGIKSQTCLREDVGLWRGTQLVRLAWKPSTPNVALDLSIGPNGKASIDPHRILLTTTYKTLGEINSAIELLKQSGAEPVCASENWSNLYPKNCTDLTSQLCHVDVFDQQYYKNKIPLLEEVSSMPESEFKENESQKSDASLQATGTYYAWNNNEIIRHMMKHSFKHEKQRAKYGLDVLSVLSGPRNKYKRAGKHEIACRTLLMASYLGCINDVAQLVNDIEVHPDIADIQGNTALMYASCGDQVDTMHFLVEAGADVNGYNDACCTPLGVALMRFACVKQDIAPSGMFQALISSPIQPQSPVSPVSVPAEWNISRDITPPTASGGIPRTASRIPGKGGIAKKLKPVLSEENAVLKKNIETEAGNADFTDDNNDDMMSDEKILYNNINAEFNTRLTELYSIPVVSPVPYLFEICDMVKEIDAYKEEDKKLPDKNPKKAISKVIKDSLKPSKEVMWQTQITDVDEFGSIDSADKMKLESMTKIMLTILQLLSDGADPALVKCPQPALLIATVSGSSELVRQLVNYGADVNEAYPQSQYYTCLDVAVSRPLTYENLDLVRIMLECGANTNHRLVCDPAAADPLSPEIPGPTILHAVLAKKTETEMEEELQHQLLEILLEYNCNPMDQFKGHSSADVALSRNMKIFEIFLKCPRTDLNAPINDANQTILVKIFSSPFCNTIPAAERLQTITNLLLFGADPLLECKAGEKKYKNIFVFAKKTLFEMESPYNKAIVVPANNDKIVQGKGKKTEKPKKEVKITAKSSGKLATDDVGDYKQALDVMTECARILHIRWLQGKLLKELMEVVVKFKHRLWNMIMPEHKNKKACGLWLSCGRALEIWDILKTTKRKIFKEKRVLRHILCIVSFYSKRSKSGFRNNLTAEERDMIEVQVKCVLRDHKSGEPSFSDDIPWCARPYVAPELEENSDEKFNVCFECILPFEKDKFILCSNCKLVSFCSLECMKVNIERTNCHPCSQLLRYKFFPSPDSTIADVL